MREIGGKTVRLVFGSPSSVFLRGFFLSMSETLSTSCPGGGADRGSDCFGEITRDLPAEVACALAGATSLFNSFFGTLDFPAATGLSAAVVLRAAACAAGLRLAVLLPVFVAITLPSKFRSWLKLPKREPCYCTSSCRCTAS